MSHFRNVMLALVLLAGVHTRAEVRPKGATMPLEVDENGMLIVKVRLSSKKPKAQDREFRFILDTGASLCVIDPSVPQEFLWDEPEKPSGGTSSVGDSTGKAIATRIVCLKRLAYAGMVREDLMAYRMDLKGTMLGRLQDEPVDGILGMNFLRGTRFVLDPTAAQIRWWQDIPGHRVPLSISQEANPTLTVRLSGTDVPCMLDTGDNGGFRMPGDAQASDHPEPFLYSGAAGEVRQGKRVQVGRIEAGGRPWVKVPLDLVKFGEGGALIGREVLLAAPLGLDFIDQWVTFTLDAQGHLPYRVMAPRPPLAWERKAGGKRLRVVPVNPSSRWAKAGLMEGDEALEVGPLKGGALTLRAVRAFSDQGDAHTWLIRREGKTLLLKVPGAE